jgi:hypothetical protein
MNMPHRNWMAGALMAGACAAWAGPNAAASLYVDLDCATPQIDSAFSRAGTQEFWVGVRVAGAKYLDSYGFKLAYDPTKLAFVRAVAAAPEEGYADFLETRGGSAPLFIGKLSARDSSRVTIANSLAGSDSAKSPGGAGLLALIRFRPLASGTARFDLEEAELLDWSQEADVPAAARGASLALDPASTARIRIAAEPSARWAGRRLEVDLGARPATLRIADARGKERFRREGVSGRQTFELPFAGRRGDFIWLQTADAVRRLPGPDGE